MSGVTDGIDLASETLQFIVDNWESQSDAVGEPGWQIPLLYHKDEKREYPDSERGKSISLKNNDIVRVSFEGSTASPEGTEFNLRREAEVDVTIESYTGAENSVVNDAVDFRKLSFAIRRAILAERRNPVTNPDCLVHYNWLEITNETDEALEEDNRDYYNTRFSVAYHGLENPP